MKAWKITRTWLRCLAAAAAASVGSTGGILPSVQAASVWDLGALYGSSSSEGFGISETSRAAGTSNDKAFRTRPNQPIDEINYPSDNLHNSLVNLIPPVSHSHAFDIRQAGTDSGIEVVGEAYNFTNWRPWWYWESNSGKSRFARVLYDGPGRAVSLRGAGGGYASAVVGHVSVNGQAHAAYWSVATNGHWLYDYGNAFYPGQESYATDTDVNRTVGYYRASPLSDYQAFVIDNGAQSLSTPPGTTGSTAYGINTFGSFSQVVGSYVTNGLTRPILWNYTGNGQSTFVILSLPPGKAQGVARGINDVGDIVGNAWSTGGDEVACRWSQYGPVSTLDSLSGTSQWSLKNAYKVNSGAAGRKIVGVGTYTGSGGPVQHGFVLSSWY